MASEYQEAEYFKSLKFSHLLATKFVNMGFTKMFSLSYIELYCMMLVMSKAALVNIFLKLANDQVKVQYS